MCEKGYTLVESLSFVAIVSVLGVVLAGTGWKVYESASLTVSANNIRQMAAGGMDYLADHNYVYWPYRNTDVNGNVTWWYGFESAESKNKTPEGQRDFDPTLGPLANYVPKGIRPDPSLALLGKAFKPKYRNGYIGIGYNVELGGGFLEGYKSQNPAIAEKNKLRNYWSLPNPSQIVVFATAAQVNTFQSPASAKNPMIEEFYSIDRQYASVHFRHNGKAMVSFADGSIGFLPMDESTRDTRMPKANIGRFAPQYSTKYLLP